MLSQAEFMQKFDVTQAELEHYASLGLLFPRRMDDHIAYDDRSILRMHIIAKGSRLEMSIDEIKVLIDSFLVDQPELG